VRYLSPEWFAAAQQAISQDLRMRELAATGLELTLEQTVTGAPPGIAGEEGTVRWHVSLEPGQARLAVGPAPEADIRFRAPYPVARAIAQGELAAPMAFIRGELTVGGDLGLLTAHQRTLATLDDVLRDVRQATTFV
jgi:predicted lipid carrier protein YhbT